jgi:hypothetical protein
MPREVDKFGTIRYYNFEGSYHREDGPALESLSGYKSWYLNGKRHRADGPAVEGGDGYKAWYLNGNEYTYDEWLEKVNHNDIITGILLGVAND